VSFCRDAATGMPTVAHLSCKMRRTFQGSLDARKAWTRSHPPLWPGCPGRSKREDPGFGSAVPQVAETSARLLIRILGRKTRPSGRWTGSFKRGNPILANPFEPLRRALCPFGGTPLDRSPHAETHVFSQACAKFLTYAAGAARLHASLLEAPIPVWSVWKT
jgi:hypothetical protein